MEKLVIVIPTKNRRVLLERAVHSVLSQSYADWRMVIINDGSRDDTQVYLATLPDADPRITVVHHERSRGVNTSRNETFKNLAPGEWAVPLDDDDYLLPDALSLIAAHISEVPERIAIVCFNTIIETPTETYRGGLAFRNNEPFQEPSYERFMLGLDDCGDVRSAYRSALFPKYLFSEDINGFEGEWIILLARDGVGIRFYPDPVIHIDQVHQGEHLSAVAARRNPRSFVRAYQRILKSACGFL